MNHILVIGGTGTVGRQVLSRLAATGAMPLPAVNMLLQGWAAAIGQAAHVTSTVAEITGAPPHTFLDWATDSAAEFLR